MKTYLLVIFSALFCSLQSCGSRTYLESHQVQDLLNSKEFTFVATRAIPMSNDIARVMGQIPGGSTTRITELDNGYVLEVKSDKITSILPYFGRTYTPSMDPDKQSYRFTSEQFSYQETEGKRNSKTITLKPSDINHVQRMVIQVFPNGRSYLTIEASDRQLISYDGYLTPNSETK